MPSTRDTIRPLTREQWAALDPTNHHRAHVDLNDGTSIPLIWRSDRAATETELAELLPEFRAFRERNPHLAQVSGGHVEDRSAA